MRILTEKSLAQAAVVDLYASVGWEAYTKDPDKLVRGIANSSHVVSIWENDRLVALARCLSDDATIMYVQDILVRPSHQRRGLGRNLLEELFQRYPHVRQTVLLTDSDPKQADFYRSLGLQNTKTFLNGTLNTFVLFR